MDLSGLLICLLYTSDEHLGIILDAANLFRAGMARKENVRSVIMDAFDRLGNCICLAHGKDISEGEDIHYTYAGDGIVDFPFFLEKLKEADYNGCMILHGIKDEKDMEKAVAFMKGLS